MRDAIVLVWRKADTENVFRDETNTTFTVRCATWERAREWVDELNSWFDRPTEYVTQLRWTEAI